MSYNGWTNYETWNVELWRSNDERVYHKSRSLIKAAASLDEKITGKHVERFFNEKMGGTTSDLKDMDDLEPINFDEIATHWEAERLELAN